MLVIQLTNSKERIETNYFLKEHIKLLAFKFNFLHYRFKVLSFYIFNRKIIGHLFYFVNEIILIFRSKEKRIEVLNEIVGTHPSISRSLKYFFKKLIYSLKKCKDDEIKT